MYGKVLEEAPFPRAGRGVKPTGIAVGLCLYAHGGVEQEKG